MKILSLLTLSLGLMTLTACADPYAPTMKPDYAIRVMTTPNGAVAVPPQCPSWATAVTDPYDNQLTPQMGCASARNLAMSVENPNDLIRGRELGPERGVGAVGSIRRYDAGQTRGLIDPNTAADSSIAATTSSAPASGISGDVTGGAPAAASSTASGP